MRQLRYLITTKLNAIFNNKKFFFVNNKFNLDLRHRYKRFYKIL